MDNLRTVAIFTGRAMRADLKSQDPNLSKSDRTFHAGRREGYLQAIAIACNCEVADIRKGVLGSDTKAKPNEMAIPDDVKPHAGDPLSRAGALYFSTNATDERPW